MKRFLKNNWIWIAGPLFVALAGAAFLIYMSLSADVGVADPRYELM